MFFFICACICLVLSVLNFQAICVGRGAKSIGPEQ